MNRSFRSSPENPTLLQPLLIRDTQRPALHFPSDNFDDCSVRSSSNRAKTHAVPPMSSSKSGEYEELGVPGERKVIRAADVVPEEYAMMVGRGSHF